MALFLTSSTESATFSNFSFVFSASLPISETTVDSGILESVNSWICSCAFSVNSIVFSTACWFFSCSTIFVCSIFSLETASLFTFSGIEVSFFSIILSCFSNSSVASFI